MLLQLLRNLRHSVATLEILGEWGTGARAEDEAALELKTDRIWMEGRAQQKRLSALQVRPCSCHDTHETQEGRAPLALSLFGCSPRSIVMIP